MKMWSLRWSLVLAASLMLVACGKGSRSAHEHVANRTSQNVTSSEGATQSPAASATVEEKAARQLDARAIEEANFTIGQNCLTCHGMDMLAQQRLKPNQWAAVLKKMQSWGALITADQSDLLLAYLVQTYPAELADQTPPTITADAAHLTLQALDDGPFVANDPQRGATIYSQKCMACHGNQGEGASLGVRLIDRPLLDQAPYFAKTVRSGRALMPAFADLSDLDVGALLAFLRRVPSDSSFTGL